MTESGKRALVSWLVLLAIALAVAIMVLTMMRPGPPGSAADGMVPLGDAAPRPVHRPA